MTKTYIIFFITVIVSYFAGVFIGIKITNDYYQDGDYIDADYEPADYFDDELISHVGYNEEQCGYNK